MLTINTVFINSLLMTDAMQCIRPAVCIHNEILCIRPAVCRHTEAMHTAGLIPNTNPNPAVCKLQFTAVLYGYRTLPLVLLFYCP